MAGAAAMGAAKGGEAAAGTLAAACVIDAARAEACRDTRAAAHLKLVSLGVIFGASVAGIVGPVVLARLFRGRPTYDRAVHIIKCFAAGVILSTALVHVLPDAFAALADCRVASRHPWRDFPFAGVVTLAGAAAALLVDLTASSHVKEGVRATPYAPLGTSEDTAALVPASAKVKALEMGEIGERAEEEEQRAAKMKQRLVSQVLEIGIIFHSVIIGVTMGMSQNRCTIKPLIAALAFHQVFEGMGLGGCIAQAGFSFGTTAYMCFMFAVTTPMGIVLGMIVFSLTGYDDRNPNALISEGLLGSLSSGVLIYMALVDLVAVDFFHNKMMDSNLNRWLKKASYIALFLGSTAMSVLALWA